MNTSTFAASHETLWVVSPHNNLGGPASYISNDGTAHVGLGRVTSGFEGYTGVNPNLLKRLALLGEVDTLIFIGIQIG